MAAADAQNGEKKIVAKIVINIARLPANIVRGCRRLEPRLLYAEVWETFVGDPMLFCGVKVVLCLLRCV